MAILKWLALVTLGGAVLAMSACSSDDEPAADKGTEADCDAIIDACHTKDDGASGELTTCHETAHETGEGTDYTYCAANKARCIALCDAAPVVNTGGTGGTGGSGTGGHSHGGAGGESHSGGTGGESHAGGTGGAAGGTGGTSGAAGSGGHSHGGAGGAAG
ncbi:MAG: hypothetical protein KC492_40745, partial [Myxococcales bacterium]|nr:hypothetical protein [Myxococcales bacterium]